MSKILRLKYVFYSKTFFLDIFNNDALVESGHRYKIHEKIAKV